MAENSNEFENKIETNEVEIKDAAADPIDESDENEMDKLDETTIDEVTQEDVKPDVAPKSANIKQGGDNEPHWYVIHTYSGYENKVKADIEKTIENRRLQEQMFEVMVPMQEVTEIKNGERKRVNKKLFPGYVLVHMILNDVTWYVVRNTRGVTGFVGPGSEPVPLTDQEMLMFGVKSEEYTIDVEEGDEVRVISGAWEGTVAAVKSVNAGKQTVTIEMDIFGRGTDVEISLSDIVKL